MPQHRFRIVLTYSESDQEYLADVPDLPECKGRGWSYAAALADVERELEACLKEARRNGKKLRPPRPPAEPGTRAHVVETLRAKFGNHRTHVFRQRIAPDVEEATFSSALSGGGQRALRVRIALAVDVLPSELWPHRSFVIRRLDDQMYLQTKAESLSSEQEKARRRPSVPVHAPA